MTTDTTTSAKVHCHVRKVYRSPSVRRDYFSLEAACRAEARAIIKRKYPTERAEDDTGYPGWHWRLLPNATKLYNRVTRMVKRSAIKGAP